MPLHAFTTFPQTAATVLAARRCPPVTTPTGNGSGYLTVFTSTGFRYLKTTEYVSAVGILKPDIAIPPVDLPLTGVTPQPKRAVRMVERTEEWLNEFFLLNDWVSVRRV